MAKLCDPDIDMIKLSGQSGMEPSIRHMIYMYYFNHGPEPQRARELTEELIKQHDEICQRSMGGE